MKPFYSKNIYLQEDSCSLCEKCDYYNYISELDKRLSSQRGIKVEFNTISEANHFFSKTGESLIKQLNKYIKKETALY